MKKLAYLATMLMSIFIISLTACKEDDTPPEITLTGDAHVITQKGAQYFDAGATATDDKDDAVYVISNLSSSNPDIDVAGDYTVTYTAQDRSGNTSTATRVVSVTFTAWQLAHNYTVTDDCISPVDSLLDLNYTASVYLDTNQVYRTFFSPFRGIIADTTYFDPVGNKLTIPTQRPYGPQTPYIVSGVGTISENAGVFTWDIYYTFTDTTGFFAPENRHAVFVSF